MTVRTISGTPITVTVTTYDMLPTTLPPGFTATSLYVGLSFEPSELIESADVSLQPVPRDFFEGDLGDLVVLHEKKDGTWEPRLTTVVITDDDMVIVSFYSDAFSDFAVVYDEQSDLAQSESGDGLGAPAATPEDAPAGTLTLFGFSLTSVVSAAAVVLLSADLVATLLITRRLAEPSRDDEPPEEE